MYSQSENIYQPISTRGRKLLDAGGRIREEAAIDVGKLGYMARILIWTTIPHSDPKKQYFERENGHFKVRITDTAGYGLPYGSYPRLLLAWMTTEAVLTGSRTLHLGADLASFMRAIGLTTDGATERLMKAHAARLFGTTVSCVSTELDRYSGKVWSIAHNWDIWWEPREHKGGYPLSVTLGRDFFEEIVDKPVPIDLRALVALKHSALAMDIYVWLTYRLSYLEKETMIGWSQLQSQFGAGYSQNENGLKNFQRQFQRSLREVLLIYPEANATCVRGRLCLKPSEPHIRKKLSPIRC